MVDIVDCKEELEVVFVDLRNMRSGPRSLAMESFINMPPEIGFGLSVWRPVAHSADEVIGQGLPFLRGKAQQYGLI